MWTYIKLKLLKGTIASPKAERKEIGIYSWIELKHFVPVGPSQFVQDSQDQNLPPQKKIFKINQSCKVNFKL